MKLKSDPRHQKRIAMMQQLFAWQVNPKTKLDEKTKQLVLRLDEIDKTIAMAEDIAANKGGVIKTHGDTHVAKADAVDPKMLAYDSSKVQVRG